MALALQWRGRHISRMRLRENIEGWIFILPAVVGLLCFGLIPILFSIYGSLSRWDAVNAPEFIGLENYRQMLVFDSFFRKVFFNTLYYTLGHIPPTVIIALLLAVLVNRKMRGITIFRTAYYIPAVTNAIAVAIVWGWLLNGDVGIINQFLKVFGIQGPRWLGDTTWAMPAVILLSVWHGLGGPMVIFLAGLQGIPEVLYEAAEIDGANRYRLFRHVTLPLLSPTTFFIVVTQFIGSFQVFSTIYILTAGGPANATNVYIYYLYQNAFSYWKMGYAAAMSWVLFFVIAVITLIQWKVARHWVFYQ